jgi:hypothetical protein
VIVAAGIGFLGAILVTRSTNENLQDNLSQTLQAQHQADERDIRETPYVGFITAFSEAVEAWEAARDANLGQLLRPQPSSTKGTTDVRGAVSRIPSPEFAARLEEFDQAVDEVVRTGTLVRMFGSDPMGSRVDDAIDEFRRARCVVTRSPCRLREPSEDIKINFGGVLDRILAQARADLGLVIPPQARVDLGVED